MLKSRKACLKLLTKLKSDNKVKGLKVCNKRDSWPLEPLRRVIIFLLFLDNSNQKDRFALSFRFFYNKNIN